MAQDLPECGGRVRRKSRKQRLGCRMDFSPDVLGETVLNEEQIG